MATQKSCNLIGAALLAAAEQVAYSVLQVGCEKLKKPLDLDRRSDQSDHELCAAPLAPALWERTRGLVENVDCTDELTLKS